MSYSAIMCAGWGVKQTRATLIQLLSIVEGVLKPSEGCDYSFTGTCKQASLAR